MENKKRRIFKSISWFIFVYLHQFTKRLLPMFSLVPNSNLNGYLHHSFHSIALPLDIRWSLPLYASWCVSSFLHTIRSGHLIAWGYIERTVQALVTFPHIHTHSEPNWTVCSVYAQFSCSVPVPAYKNSSQSMRNSKTVIASDWFVSDDM